jgi:predicted nucleic acid-binding protein
VNFVLDASVALSWAFEDERGEGALAVLDRLHRSEAVTSAIWPIEVANALLTAERRGRIEPEAANRFAALLLELPIAIDPIERRRPFEAVRRLARSHELSAYDASYLELALRLGIPLVTLDSRLRDAALEAGAGVSVD